MGGKGFLGTNASLLSDITLVLSLTVALILTVGVYMAVKKRFVIHRWLQTTAVVLNASLVLLVMVGSFMKSAKPGIPDQIDQTYYAVALAHGLIGLVAFVFGSFVALRGNELVPSALKFNNYKRFMRTAYGLYMLATVLGVVVYITWYGKAAPVAEGQGQTAQSAAERLVPMVNFAFNPGEIVVPVGTTITWVNNDPAPHSATADDGLGFDSGLLSSSQAFTFTFATIGEFAYFCTLHGSPGGVDMAGTIKVVAADQAPAAAAPVDVATATPPPTPHPLPAQFLGQPAGVAAFRDVRGHNDQLVLELKLPAAPPADQALQAFLTSADGSQVYPLGPLQTAAGANATLEHTAAAGENLLDRFSRIIVTQEPAGSSPAQPSGPPLFESALPAQVLPAIRQLLVAGPGGAGAGSASQLRAQTAELLRHAQFIDQARAAGDLAAIARHAEHVYNLVAGSRDPQFGDRDGDGRAQNPGDGFGLLQNGDQAGYIQASAASASAASQAPDATEAVTVHAGHVQVCTTNMQGWATTVRDLALQLTQTTDAAAAGAQIDQLLALSAALSVGDDVNADGHITPVPGECGAQVAHEHAQYMAGFGLFPVNP